MPQTPTSPPTEAPVPGKSGPQATGVQGPEGPTGGAALSLNPAAKGRSSGKRKKRKRSKSSREGRASKGRDPSAESGCDQVPHVAPVHGTGDHPATEAHASDSEFHFGRMISCYTFKINFS
jgi:hypothetical protein